ncbi:hypothetical protein LPB41_14295 [Thalassospira sp. MA62]|nr:hypothetical protein [Thalassospira sp. MA62]
MAQAKFLFVTSFPPDGKNAADPVGPYLLPPGFEISNASQPMAIYFSYFCTPSTTNSTPGITTSQDPSQSVFGLTFDVISSKPNPFFAAVKITISQDFIYSADPEQRQKMLEAFRIFAAQIEALEVSIESGKGGLLPGCTEILLGQISTNLPLTLSEVLQYAYNYDAKSQFIDLLPGMALRLDYASYQYCGPAGSPGYGLNSFVDTGSQKVQIARNADNTISFDQFLGRLHPGVALSPAPECPQFAAGPLDLAITGQARRHWRLVLPATLPGPSNIDNQGASEQSSAILLGAETLAELNKAASAVLAGNTGCDIGMETSKPIVSISFTGRVVAVPEFDVIVNDQTVSVPVGTTFKDIVYRFAFVPPLQIINLKTSSKTPLDATLQRWVVDPARPQTSSDKGMFYIAATKFIEDSSAPYAPAGPDGEVFDVPLLRGDRLVVAPGNGYQS